MSSQGHRSLSFRGVNRFTRFDITIAEIFKNRVKCQHDQRNVKVENTIRPEILRSRNSSTLGYTTAVCQVQCSRRLIIIGIYYNLSSH